MNNALVVQKKSMPCKKPKKRGGSPNGEREPPIFATKNMKNIIVWTLYLLHLFALKRGRINNIEAPVVPIHEARIVPIIIITQLNIGKPEKFPLILIPPDIV